MSYGPDDDIDSEDDRGDESAEFDLSDLLSDFGPDL